MINSNEVNIELKLYKQKGNANMGFPFLYLIFKNVDRVMNMNKNNITIDDKKNILQYFGICILFFVLNINFIGSIGNTIYSGLFFCFSGCDVTNNTLILGIVLILSLLFLIVFVNYCFFNFLKTYKQDKNMTALSFKEKLKILLAKTEKQKKTRKEKILLVVKIVFFTSILRLLPFSVFMIGIYSLLDKKIKLFCLVYFSIIYFKIASSIVAGIGLLTNHLAIMNGNLELGKNIFELSLKSDILKNTFNLYQFPIVFIAIYALSSFNDKKYIRSLWTGCLSVVLALSLWNYDKHVLHTDRYQKVINETLKKYHSKENTK